MLSTCDTEAPMRGQHVALATCCQVLWLGWAGFSVPDHARQLLVHTACCTSDNPHTQGDREELDTSSPHPPPPRSTCHQPSVPVYCIARALCGSKEGKSLAGDAEETLKRDALRPDREGPGLQTPGRHTLLSSWQAQCVQPGLQAEVPGSKGWFPTGRRYHIGNGPLQERPGCQSEP